ncbi:MAG: hypothetical protein M3252_02245, partial [Actinomycetota bacterium]|nr:hypothetical protein [Actinomycetota bacterium]
MQYLVKGDPESEAAVKPNQGEVVGSCYGFAVSSPLRFQFLRPANGGVPLHISEWQPDGETDIPWDLEWPPGPGRELHAGVRVRPDHDVFWTHQE